MASGATIAYAQLNLPVRNIGGTDYYYRTVQKKETIYGISKELGIPKEDIIKYNPSVASGLQKDQVLYFPVSAYGGKKTAATRPTDHKHIVKNGETLYGIAKMYGISVAELLESNPQARTGLKADTVLTIPVAADKSEAFPYVVKAGDTLYRLSVNFNVDLKDLLEINPGVSPDNFQAGMTVMIPPASTKKPDGQPETVFVQNKVEKGDSFESISQEYGVTSEQLREANPDVDKLKRGSFVTVPVSNATPTDTTVTVRQAYRQTSDNTAEDGVNIVILLPFEAKSATKSKQALFYRDFYRGALLALNEHTSEKVNLSVYDVNASTLPAILNKKDMTKAHAIFAPSEDVLLNRIVDYGQKNGINVVNAFSVNNDMCYDNDRVFLINTPSSYMYSSVRNYIESNYSDCEIVFLKEDGVEEKPLIEYLKLTNMPQRTVSISETDNFTCRHKTLFVPTSSSKASLKKLKSLVDALNADPANDGKFSIFGYPEWTLYSEYENFMHTAGVTIFSRYSLESSDKKLASKYKYWYGEQPINSIPSMYELGYDVANYFIATIRQCNNDFNKSLPEKDGQEIGINMVRTSNWGGFVNTASFIYKYSKNGVNKTLIK